MISITDDMVAKLNNAAQYWNDYYHSDKDAASTEEKYFDYWCKETYGIKVTVVQNSTTFGHQWMTWDKAEITDDEKYTWFLLSF
jgi:hypothetical protein